MNALLRNKKSWSKAKNLIYRKEWKTNVETMKIGEDVAEVAVEAVEVSEEIWEVDPAEEEDSEEAVEVSAEDEEVSEEVIGKTSCYRVTTKELTP